MSMPDPNAKLSRKLRNKTSILTDEEVTRAAMSLREMLGPAFAEFIDRSPGAMEDSIRWSAVGAKCENERLKRGWSLKEAAAKLHVPKYRLEAIEKRRLRELKPEVARRYFSLLCIEPWVGRWARAHPDLAGRAGIAPSRRRNV